jgi:hypothetical protein
MSSQEKNNYEKRFSEVMDYTNEIVELLILTKSSMEMPQNAGMNKIKLIQNMWDQELCYKILVKLRDKLKFVDEFCQYSRKFNNVSYMTTLITEKTLINDLINHISRLHTNKFVYSAFTSFICGRIEVKEEHRKIIEKIHLIAPVPPTTKIIDKKIIKS